MLPTRFGPQYMLVGRKCDLYAYRPVKLFILTGKFTGAHFSAFLSSLENLLVHILNFIFI